MARSRRKQQRSNAIVVRSAPQPIIYSQAPAQLAPRGSRGLVMRGYRAVRKRTSKLSVRRIGGLSAGGAAGTALQGTAQGLGLGPIFSKIGVQAIAVALGSGAEPGSWSDHATDGMIASAGSGIVFDIIDWWKNRNKKQ